MMSANRLFNFNNAVDAIKDALVHSRYQAGKLVAKNFITGNLSASVSSINRYSVTDGRNLRHEETTRNLR